jgi:hypothetical protein
MERGIDPEVKKYFRKILYSLFFGLLWLVAGITAGVYYELAFFNDNPVPSGIYYFGLAASLFFLLRYYVKAWSK